MSQTPTGFISDGYTQKGYVAEVPRLHQQLRFEFRPFTQDQRGRILAENSKLKASEAALNMAKAVAAKLVSWSLRDPKGEPVACKDPHVLLKLTPALYDRVLGIVLGVEPSDDDPDAGQEEREESLADQLLAAEKNIALGDAQAIRAEGN